VGHHIAVAGLVVGDLAEALSGWRVVLGAPCEDEQQGGCVQDRSHEGSGVAGASGFGTRAWVLKVQGTS
jgi:hypothetical protein